MDKIAIVYPGGAYGTFLHWCLRYFTEHDFSEELPFTPTGSAHKFDDAHLHDMTILDYLARPKIHKDILRMHWSGMTTDYNLHVESVSDRINLLRENFNHIIFIMPTEENILWISNNSFSKAGLPLKGSSVLKNIKGEIELNNLLITPDDISCLENWPINDYENIDRWILREWLSMSYYEGFKSQAGFPALDQFEQIGRIITCDQLKDSFNETIRRCVHYIGRKMIREEKLDYIYQQWITRQHYIGSDALVSNIVSATINDQDISWKKLTFIEEVWVQKELRDCGYELKCQNLNDFPINSKQLRELIYETTE